MCLLDFSFLRWASIGMLLESKLYFCSSKISILQDTEGWSNLCRHICKKNLNRKSNFGDFCCGILLKFSTAIWQRGENKNWWGLNMSLETVQQSNLKPSEVASLVRDKSLFHDVLSVLDILSWRVNHTAVGRLSDECVQEGGGHHDGGAFWFWYMDALSFKRSRQRWQLQLPECQNNRNNLLMSDTFKAECPWT